jgi:two-component system sensor histidine kinase/response regulator
MSGNRGVARAVGDRPVEAQARGLQILLAEDNVVNRKLATALLEKRGHVVIAAENGRVALDLLEHRHVDLVLMDVQMPVMDGLEAIRAIRVKEQGNGSHLPIIALTAHAMKGDRERCIEAGADEYMTKPIRTDELFAAINRIRDASPPAAPPLRPARPSSNKVLDSAGLLERIEGDRELLDELVRLFHQDWPASMASMVQAQDDRDANALEHLAHALKGTSANLGAQRVFVLAGELERQAQAADWGHTGGSIERLGQEVEQLLPELTLLCKKGTS